MVTSGELNVNFKWSGGGSYFLHKLINLFHFHISFALPDIEFNRMQGLLKMYKRTYGYGPIGALLSITFNKLGMDWNSALKCVGVCGEGGQSLNR